MTEGLHADRGRAESFGAEAERYDRTRPGYPPEVIAAVLGPNPSGLRVLDVGCGTGIASRLISEAGADVLGVEPDEQMAAVARRRGSTVEVARFEDWDAAGRRFDRVSSAQAWHWVDPVAGAAKAADVLEPGGRLCLLGNEGAFPDDLGGEIDKVYQRLAPTTDRYSVLLSAATRDPQVTDSDEVNGIVASGRFDDPVVEGFAWGLEYTTKQWVAQLPTHSDHARMAADERERLLDAVAAVIDRHGGRFTMRYTTLLVFASSR